MRKSKASEAQRVAQDIAAIRTALKKHGYQLRKRPKQAAWTILPPLNTPKRTPSSVKGSGRVREETKKTYLLTYQPAPISRWVLHPQDNTTERHTLETLIQRAIKTSAS